MKKILLTLLLTVLSNSIVLFGQQEKRCYTREELVEIAKMVEGFQHYKEIYSMCKESIVIYEEIVDSLYKVIELNEQKFEEQLNIMLVQDEMIGSRDRVITALMKENKKANKLTTGFMIGGITIAVGLTIAIAILAK